MTRTLALVVAGAVVSLALVPPAGAQVAPTTAQRLVDTYSPIVMLRAQRDPPCDKAKEQFDPTTVDVMLGNPRVRLRRTDASGRLRTVTRAPSVADVAARDKGWYLDVPGDALNPGCTYAKDFAALRRAGRAPPIAYAHIARELGQPGLVVQYFFFYYYNQFNDLHEGDWEGMQVAFDGASTPEQALAQDPTRIALFQHAGGEKADWDDGRVEKEGTHPVVYPAAGSHATFFASAVYVENGNGGSGLGCDNTSEPLRRLRPRPVLVPDAPRPDGRFGWLTYLGHWGERHGGFSNGPTGPITKRQWSEPFAWMSGLRRASPQLPSGALAGPAVTGAFCGAVATVSSFVNLKARTTLGALLIAALVLLLVVVPPTLTRWRPVDLENLRRPRALGQLLRAARQLYGRHWRTLVIIGLASLPILAAVEGLNWAVKQLIGAGNTATAGSSGAQINVADPISSIGRPIAFALVAATVITFVRELELGRPAGVLQAARGMLARFWRLVFCQLAGTLAVVLLALTIIGIPFAIRKYVDWQFVQQQIVFRDTSIRDAFRGSRQVVRGRWWRTLRIAGFFWLLSIVVGPMLGFALIFADLSLPAINLFGSVVFALLTPYVALGRTLLFFDLESRARPVPQTGP